MPSPIDWTEAMLATLREMRDEGCPCHEIAAALDISKNAVVNRCDRLGMATGVRFRRERFVPQPEHRDDAPLPPGHPVSWGAIALAGAVWTGTGTGAESR